MLFVGVLAVLALAGLASAQSPVLVKGQPPLTEEMVGGLTEYFEWAFDVFLTNDQRLGLRNYAVDAWTRRKKSDMDLVVQAVQQQAQLSRLDAEQRATLRVTFEPDLLDAMRKQPNAPIARWALAVYKASHRTIAPGTPPLTRQSTDAFLDALFFMVGVVSGEQAVPDQKLKDDWAKALAANYPNMSAELKQQIAGMPMLMATIRMSWPGLSKSVKAQYRAQWAEELKTLLPAPATASSAAKPATSSGKALEQAKADQDYRHKRYMDWSSSTMQSYSVKSQANKW
jgi:hypothetical protein